MQKFVSFDIARKLNKLGFNETTEYFYMNTHIGIRAVLGDPNKPSGERIYHEGDICKSNKNWGVTYPSEHWIPAPYLFDVIIWLKNEYKICVIPVYDETTGVITSYKIYIGFTLKEEIVKTVYSLQQLFEYAITYVLDNFENFTK